MMIKKLSLAIAMLSAFAIISCTPQEEVAPASVSIDPTSLIFEYNADATEAASQPISLTATRDWTATVNGEGLTVLPSSGSGSNDPQTITITADKNDGKTKTATVTFAISSGQTATLNVTIYGTNGDEFAFSDIYNAAVGTEVKTSGLVVAVNSNSIMLQDDEDEYLLIFGGNEATEPGASIGDVVTVKGTTAKYGDLMQLTAPEITKTGIGEVIYGTPEVITSENITKIDLTRVTYLQMEGIYSTSTSEEGFIYHNLAISGTEVQGSIQYPIDDLGLADMVGHNITVTGFFAGGNNQNFRNIMAVKVVDNGEPQVDLLTVKDVIEAEKGTLVKTDGTVMAVCTKGYIIADETGAIYVYTNSAPEVAVGNTVTVSGSRDEYSGCKQIGNPTTIVDNPSTTIPTYPTAKVITGATLDTYTVTTAEYVEVSGTLSGTRITVSGAKRTVSLSYPSGDLNYSAMNGLNVTLKGYVSNLYSGNDYETLYIIATSIEAEPYINANDVSVGASATSATIDVFSNVSNWAVSCSDSWITDYTKSGSNDGKIEVTFDANTNASANEATFEITGNGVTKKVKLIQGAYISDGQTTNLSFVGWNFDGADSWSSSYTSHDVKFDVATVKFASANKQSQTIEDCPVTKGGDIEVIMNSGYTMAAITFNLKQWTSKTQTASLYTSTDGGSTYSSEEMISSSNFVLTASALPEGTNAVKVKFSSSSNQVGLSSIDLTYITE